MTRFFRRMPLDKPVVRTNYSFQRVARPEAADARDPHELAWARTMKGDEDVDAGEPGFLRAEASPYVEDSEEAGNGSEALDPACVRLRVERQTLRRLPKTGAIVFTIRVYLTPIEELAKEPGIPGRMASAIRSWPDDVARYKARSAFDGILGYLDEQHAAQVARGVTTEPDKA
ncbi:hypothetical protein EIP86_010312 [Pleurotus ostreatoroseus]|nr:hypothetical protein EIP86_010312 [Pleurotus ostreatoroseus]